MSRYAIIRNMDSVVENVCVWDGASAWLPPDGTFVMELGADEMCQPDYSYQPDQSPRFVASNATG